MEVYLDLVMLLNFGVDLLLLLGTNRLSGHPPDTKKAVLAALLGGIYAGACVLPGWTFLGNLAWRIVSLGLISCIAFGLDKSALQRGILFVFLSMALGGTVLVIGKGGFWSVLLSALMLSFLCLLGFRGRAGKEVYASVSIRHHDKIVNMTALLDTGNTLKDPVSGCPVLVADARAAYEILGLEEDALLHPIETISRGNYPGLRLIPYCAVGQPAGILLGLRVEELRINGKTVDQIVAFAPQTIGKGCGYQALTGGIV